MSLDEQTGGGSLREVAALLGVPDAAALKALGLDSLRRRTHRELIEVGRRLGLAGISRMTKDVLASRLWESLSTNGRSGPVGDSPSDEGTGEKASEGGHLSHKFEVGEHGAATTEEPRTIPWSYGMDRVTALPVDPDRLMVYWELTDEAIAKARPQLGDAGAGAWVDLRVYDTTGLIFDGTNAHSYFDHKVERHERQWFFQLGKPSSQAVVEIGLRSHEGYFVKIARSGRVDFPRRAPGGWTEPEWMTVRAGGVESAGRGMPGGGQAAALPGGGGAMRFDQMPLWQQFHGPGEEQIIRMGEHGREERVQWEEVWRDADGEVHRTVSWESPVMVSSWEAGPFTYPVEIPGATTQSFEGALNVYKVDGKTHIVYGPWQVVIRGLGAHYQRQVVARWEVHRSWVAEEGHEIHGVRVVAHEGAGPGGSSELVAMGSSELRWRGASELRLMGGSERMYVGASERRAMGASERLFRGASEWLVRGASERRLAGQSELRFAGASEKMFAGASERRLGGGSEGRLGGASEARLDRRLDDEGSEGASAYPRLPGTFTNG